MKQILRVVVSLCIGTILLAGFYRAAAHEIQAGDTTMAAAATAFAAIESNTVRIWQDSVYRYIESNGIPDHATGQFPNRGNPNTISTQQYHYRVLLHPQLTGHIIEMRGQPFGVAVNGIPFDPGTAECWGQPRGSRPSGNCAWRKEAIVQGQGKLGLDQNNAHVQPNGAYHYHGVPTGLLALLPKEDLTPIGYATDGFKIYVSRSGKYLPSYRLKTGQRPDGPGGRYDGTYTQDFEYVNGAGELDECNGRMIHGEYAYVATRQFPYLPRCWKGTPDKSFSRHAPEPNDRRHGPPPPPGLRPPPR